jgi:hypothetical protein
MFWAKSGRPVVGVVEGACAYAVNASRFTREAGKPVVSVIDRALSDHVDTVALSNIN